MWLYQNVQLYNLTQTSGSGDEGSVLSFPLLGEMGPCHRYHHHRHHSHHSCPHHSQSSSSSVILICTCITFTLYMMIKIVKRMILIDKNVLVNSINVGEMCMILFCTHYLLKCTGFNWSLRRSQPSALYWHRGDCCHSDSFSS